MLNEAAAPKAGVFPNEARLTHAPLAAADEAVLAAINVAAQQDRRGGRGDDGVWETRQGWTAASVLKRKFVF